MAERTLVLGLDVSTTGAKALLIDGTGVVVSSATVELALSMPKALWSEQAAAEAPSRVCFTIEPMEGVCRLRVIHDSFPEKSQVLEEISQGWSGILSSLKSLLETGEPLRLAGKP